MQNIKPGWMRNIHVVPYDAGWPAAFEAERAQLLDVFGAERVEIHHIGSTSVPGLAAKPLIDILLVAKTHAVIDARDAQMEALGYRVRGETGIAGRRYFTKGPDEARTHHVHAFPAGHAEVARHLGFRDYLRAHPAAVRAYGDLKRELAEAHRDDIQGYMDGKAPLIRQLLVEMERWRAEQA